jgi:hypothetical protein
VQSGSQPRIGRNRDTARRDIQFSLETLRETPIAERWDQRIEKPDRQASLSE